MLIFMIFAIFIAGLKKRFKILLGFIRDLFKTDSLDFISAKLYEKILVILFFHLRINSPF